MTDKGEENVWMWEVSKRQLNISKNAWRTHSYNHKGEDCAVIVIEQYGNIFSHPSDPIIYTYKLNVVGCLEKAIIFCQRI